MNSKSIEVRVEQLINNIITDLGYELYDVQYIKDGKDYYLRVTIDSKNGIKISDCEKVNDALDNVLDEADIIKDTYFLEISSPGIERVLRKPKHFEKQLGKLIYIKLFDGINKQKEFEGILKEYMPNKLILDIDGKFIEIETKNIAIAKTIENIF